MHGASGPTVSEDGSCRASDTCALQSYVQMCMRSTLCSGDRHTTSIPTKKARDKLGIVLCSNRAHVTVARQQSCDHTTSRQQGNLRLTHFQCSQYVWSRNQVRVTSIHAADSVTFAERERVRKSKSRSPSKVHRSCGHFSQIQQRVAPSSTCLSQNRWCHGTHIQIHTMNTADSNVTDMNIPHITECLSSFSVTFIEDRFCLFRT